MACSVLISLGNIMGSPMGMKLVGICFLTVIKKSRELYGTTSHFLESLAR
jgi:hypothetical protein